MGDIKMTMVKCESDGIEFCHDDGSWFYDLHIDEIKRNGLAFWLEHLGRKKWFTESVKRQFLDYCESLQVEK